VWLRRDAEKGEPRKIKWEMRRRERSRRQKRRRRSYNGNRGNALVLMPLEITRVIFITWLYQWIHGKWHISSRTLITKIMIF
jgi:hypothetical protein